MALVDTRFNSYLPPLSLLASNNVIKTGVVVTVQVQSLISPGTVRVKSATNFYNGNVFVNHLPDPNITAYNVSEKQVFTVSDITGQIKVHPISSIEFATDVTKIVANVVTVVVEESSRIYNHTISYAKDKIMVITQNKNFATDTKPIQIATQRVVVNDLTQRKTVKTERLRESSRFKVEVVERRTANIMETKILPVNVVYDAINVSSGGGGGGSGPAVLTEYWS